MTTKTTPTRSRRYMAAQKGISELTYHMNGLIEQLATETGRYERIALEDHLEATEKLIAYFKVELAREVARSTNASPGTDARVLSAGEAPTLSNHYDG